MEIDPSVENDFKITSWVIILATLLFVGYVIIDSINGGFDIDGGIVLLYISIVGFAIYGRQKMREYQSTNSNEVIRW